MVEFHIKNGTTCLVVTGTTGECPTLTFEEHIAAIKTVCDAAKGRILVMAGAGSNNPVEAINLSNATKDAELQTTFYIMLATTTVLIRKVYMHTSLWFMTILIYLSSYTTYQRGRTVVNITSGNLLLSYLS